MMVHQMQSAHFKMIQSNEIITPLGGLSFVGHVADYFIKIRQLVDTQIPMKRKDSLPLSSLIKAYLGLLSSGKSDFDAIENYREDPFYQNALGLKIVPSAPTLRLRFEEHAQKLSEITSEFVVPLLKNGNAKITPIYTGHIVLDGDGTAYDNSNTKKAGVGRTYLGFDGYTSNNFFLGEEGWCISAELAPGVDHCAKNIVPILERALNRATQLTRTKLLVRLDSGYDSLQVYETLIDASKNIKSIDKTDLSGYGGIDFLVKWNPRNYANRGDSLFAQGQLCADFTSHTPRIGKEIATFSEKIQVKSKTSEEIINYTRVYRITKRTIDKLGQCLMLPSYEVDAWNTNLKLNQFNGIKEENNSAISIDEMIELYKKHATMEQFHSEIKTDLDLERFPSGKLEVNTLILNLAAVTYNILRLIGQNTLLKSNSPVRHKAKRRRLKTVIQEVIYCAAKMTNHARVYALNFGKNWRGFEAIHESYSEWKQLCPI